MIFALALLGFGAALHFPVGAAAAGVSPLPDAFTPVVARFVGDETAPVLGSDSRWHVVYELWLTNARPVTATLESIEVLDDDRRDRVVATLDGKNLADALHDLSARATTDATLAPGASKLVFVELTFANRGDVPAAIVHRIRGQGGVGPASQTPAPMAYLAAKGQLSQAPLRELGPPLRGSGWVAVNGCCSSRGAHRGAILPISGQLRDSQRFAIDWLRFDASGRMLSGDPARVESFLAYDQPVLAVADARVVATLDGLDDQVPGALPDPSTITVENVDGNHVILELGSGRYVFYAHLKKGSLRVKPGDRVTLGQEIARLGNTGNTSAPHLHLHVMDGPSALGADGMPYVYTAFELTGQLDAAQWYAPDSGLDDVYPSVPGDARGPRAKALPLDLRIVTFPDVKKSTKDQKSSAIDP